MAKPRFLHAPVVLAFLLPLLSATGAVEVQPAPGMVLERFIDLRDLSAFTWDEHGTVWVLSEKKNRLIVSSIPKPGEIQMLGSFARRGHERASLLIHANRVFVSDGDALRKFEIKDRKHLLEQSPLRAPPNLFPQQTHITSLGWAPLGHISFLYRSNKETGIGRLEVRRDRWDVIAKGLAGDLAYDLTGFPIASDESSGHLFRLRLGLDYARGLHNYTKNDLALATDKPELKAAAIAVHPGANWAEENRGTWLVSDRATSSLQQFTEEEGRLKHWRNLARWNEETSNLDLQIGPDGAIWLLLDPGGQGLGSICRLRPANLTVRTNPLPDIPGFETEDVVAFLKDANSWQRETALRVLDDREDLRQARGLHPGTALHRLYNDTNATEVARLHALLSLHRLELLEETMLEGVSDASASSHRAWAALLFGERNYPTGTAFDMLLKLAKEPDINVRMAAAVAARQFVSGSLAIDTTPRAMPIREVFTGGILSTLWFSTEKSRSPALDLLFWNAVRPISAYDSAHPMGFFNGDREEGLPIAYWIVGLITQQIAEQDNPLKQEDAMLMLGKLKPTNARMILAALQGLKNGTPRRRAAPTEKSLRVLRDYSQSENCAIATLAQEILVLWQNPVRH